MEQNPEACKWFKENTGWKQVEDRIHVIQGDASNPPIRQGTTFDRIIIPTPYGMDWIFDILTPFIRTGGLIHFYTFKNRAQSEQMEHAFEQKGFTVITKGAGAGMSHRP